jgi:hypothetical protein
LIIEIDRASTIDRAARTNPVRILLGRSRSARRVHRRVPTPRGSRAANVNPLEQHRQLMHIELDARRAVDDPRRKREGAALEPLCGARCYAKPFGRPLREGRDIGELAPVTTGTGFA